MTAPAIDWERAEREERRRQRWTLPFVVTFVTGVALLRGGSPLGSGHSGWVLLAGYAALGIVVAIVIRLRPAARERAAIALRVQAALRLHADPGAELHERTDRQARFVAGRRWVRWAVLLVVAGAALGAEWMQHPTRSSAGVLLVSAAGAASSRWWSARSSEAERWLADPPGPPRDPPPSTRVERWTTGRNLVRFLIALVMVSIAAGFLAARLD